MPGPSEACPGDRMIGVRPEQYDDCPDAVGQSAGGHWETGKLFDGVGALDGELDRYCVYSWQPEDPNEPSLPDSSSLPTGDTSSTDWLAPDCNTVAAAGHPLGDANWPTLEQAIFDQVERVAPLGAGTQGPARTRVDVIDSAIDKSVPAGTPSVGRLRHGRAMGLLVRNLACPNVTGSECAAAVASTLALKLEMTPSGLVRNETFGGFFGSQGDLAQAIVEAVRRAGRDAPDNQLVINLSLGWESRYGGAIGPAGPTALAGPVRAVHSALQYATCQGALVIAAAGNSSGGPALSSGPMYPAGWESQAAPSAARCNDLDAGSPPTSSAPYQPLLYSVGGVDGRDDPIVNTRAGGRPRIAAPASHAATASRVVAGTIVPSEVYTGSSVAAAVASGAAALVWGYAPALAPADVMRIVYSSGVDLGVPADYCRGGSCANVRRASMCRALHMVCALGSSRCPATLPACPTTGAYRDLRPTPISVTSFSPSTTGDASGLTNEDIVGAPCNATVVYDAVPANPCIAEQYPGNVSVPWVEPQPDNPPCTICLLDASEVLYLGISSVTAGPLTDAVLTATFSSGLVKKYDLSAEVGTVWPGDSIKVTGLGVAPSDLKSATVDFLVGGEYAASDQVLLGY